jgi:hypothetical protein
LLMQPLKLLLHMTKKARSSGKGKCKCIAPGNRNCRCDYFIAIGINNTYPSVSPGSLCITVPVIVITSPFE